MLGNQAAPRLRIEPAEPGHGADAVLVSLPARPEEALVVEGRRNEAREAIDEGKAIVRGRPLRVDRTKHHAVAERLDGCPAIGIVTLAVAQIEDRVRLLDAGREDAARAVILEAAADDRNAIGEQRGGNRVAGEAGS